MTIKMNKKTSHQKIDSLAITPDKLKVSKESGVVIGITSNHKNVDRSNHKGKRNRRNNTYRVPEDWNRNHRDALACIDNNFADDDPNCYYVVAHIKNQHIKSIKKARDYLHSFEKNLPKGSSILGFIELNKEHHPHIHMIIRNRKGLLSPFIIKSHWLYGEISKVVIAPDHLRDKILNYSIKRYSSDAILKFDKEKANNYQQTFYKLTDLISELKKRRGSLKGYRKRNCRSILGQAFHLKRKYSRLLKEENQKQVMTKDNPVYKTYGLGTNRYQVITDSNKIEEVIKNLKPQSCTKTSLISYESTTGEVIGNPLTFERVTFIEGC